MSFDIALKRLKDALDARGPDNATRVLKKDLFDLIGHFERLDAEARSRHTATQIAQQNYGFSSEGNRLATIKRIVVDQAVAQTIDELQGLIPETMKDLHEICGVAAINAVAQFSTHTESQIRLIELHHKMKLNSQFMKEYPISGIRSADPGK